MPMKRPSRHASTFLPSSVRTKKEDKGSEGVATECNLKGKSPSIFKKILDHKTGGRKDDVATLYRTPRLSSVTSPTQKTPR